MPAAGCAPACARPGLLTGRSTSPGVAATWTPYVRAWRRCVAGSLPGTSSFRTPPSVPPPRHAADSRAHDWRRPRGGEPTPVADGGLQVAGLRLEAERLLRLGQAGEVGVLLPVEVLGHVPVGDHVLVPLLERVE